jgi:hypothetical protein
MRCHPARWSLTGREGRGALSAQTGRAALFGRLAARLRSAVGIADIAGARHGLSDLFVRGGLARALFGGRHFRQEIELALAIDQDRDQHLAVLGKQDALPPLFGTQPDAERKADRPVAHDDAAIVIDHEDRAVRLRLIGEGFRDLVVAGEDRFDGVQLGGVFMQRGLPAAKDQRYPFLGVNKAGAAASAAIKSSIALMPIAPE